MIIVAGHIVVDPADRDDYLATCRAVVEQARGTPGCLDFALTADTVEPGRINVFERWSNAEVLAAFRGAGSGDDLGARILDADVREFDVSDERRL